MSCLGEINVNDNDKSFVNYFKLVENDWDGHDGGWWNIFSKRQNMTQEWLIS